MSWIKLSISELLFFGFVIYTLSPVMSFVGSGKIAILIAVSVAVAMRISIKVMFASQKANILIFTISSGFAIFAADSCLLFFRTELFQAHELASIPPQVTIINDYILTKQIPGWKRVVREEGQAATYIGKGIFPSFKNTVTTDKNGYRNPSNPNNNSNSGTIILGDSFAFGYGVSDDDTIGSLLNRNGVSNYNLGVYGTSVGNGVELLLHEQENGLIKRALENVVVLIFEGNDLTDRNVYASKRTLAHSRMGQYYSLLREYSVLSLLRHNIMRLFSTKKEGNSPYLLFESQSLGYVALLKKDFLRSRILNESYEIANRKFLQSDIPASLSKLAQIFSDVKITLVYIPIKARLLNSSDRKRLFDSPGNFVKFGVSDVNWVKKVTNDFAVMHGFAVVDVEELCLKSLEFPLKCFLKGDTHLSPLGLNLVSNNLMPILSLPR